MSCSPIRRCQATKRKSPCKAVSCRFRHFLTVEHMLKSAEERMKLRKPAWNGHGPRLPAADLSGTFGSIRRCSVPSS
eukprot:11926211-Alexandrium_andersonii.AAC.1